MSEKYFFDFHPSKLTILKKNSDSSVTIAHENRIDSKVPRVLLSRCSSQAYPAVAVKPVPAPSLPMSG